MNQKAVLLESSLLWIIALNLLFHHWPTVDNLNYTSFTSLAVSDTCQCRTHISVAIIRYSTHLFKKNQPFKRKQMRTDLLPSNHTTYFWRCYDVVWTSTTSYAWWVLSSELRVRSVKILSRFFTNTSSWEKRSWWKYCVIQYVYKNQHYGNLRKINRWKQNKRIFVYFLIISLAKIF